MQSIKEIRQSTGLSQQKFGEALNIPRRTVQDWEQGLRNCPEYVAELIAYRVANDPTILKVEEPQPLTIEELQQLEGEPVYVVPRNPVKGVEAEWCVMWGKEACPPAKCWAWKIGAYGDTWTAYRHKPKK